MKSLVIALGAMLTLLLSAHADIRIPGSIKTFMVKGDVTFSGNDIQGEQHLKRGMVLRDGVVVKTGEGSRALLLLSNGSTVNLSENSVLYVEKFDQEIIDPNLPTYLRLKEEPSRSDISLNLLYGQMVGKAKPLKEGTDFKLKTEIGAVNVTGDGTFLVSSEANQEGQHEIRIANLRGGNMVLNDQTTMPIKNSMIFVRNEDGSYTQVEE